LKNGDGCDDQCEIEPGYECYNGNSENADTCYEICGDGLDFFEWPCDDGNVINWDGCDRLCNIENGWTCTGGTNTSPDVCDEIPGDCW